jgi:hypothetical protein
MEDKQVLILNSQDGEWLSIYVEGELVYEDHEINKLDFLKLAEEYKFHSSDVIEREANDIDNENCENVGCFPNSIHDLNGKYE